MFLWEVTVNQQLIDTLKQVGKPSHDFRSADGSEVLVLPYGGRILGLFTPGSCENLYWTHPALESVPSATDFYAGQQWHNSGGDRTWLAPELDFFLPNYPQIDVYFQPRQLDPGDWRLSVETDSVRLVNRLAHRLSRSGEEVDLEITKTISSALDPLRHESGAQEMADVEYAGYTLRSTLRLTGAESVGPVGLWNLIQMPHGGDMLVATYFASQPRILFGDVNPQDVVVRDHVICYTMRASGEHKLGIRAVGTTGRIGYRYPVADGHWVLIVRNVFINPSGAYVDVPWSDPLDVGYALQACNVNSALGSFSELEYHAPAIGAGTGRVACEDISQTWAYRGSRTAIDRVVERLVTRCTERQAEG
jgi:hypothetical protein